MDISQWTEQNVADWLTLNAFGQYALAFLDNNINGPVLLELTYESLKDVGVIKVSPTSGHINKRLETELVFYKLFGDSSLVLQASSLSYLVVKRVTEDN
jgi:SAM domain (Sterile alpha motif)